MSLELDVRHARGVTRSADLLSLGWSARKISRAVCAGRLIQPKRGWVALPDADPLLLVAVRRGAVVTCITQAKRLGLWVLAESEPHFAAPRRGSRPVGEGCVMHWGKPLSTRVPGVLEDPIENVLGHVADCQPYEAALVVWDSALNRGLIDKPTIRRFPLRPRARRLLEDCSPLADSGLETLVRTRLRFLRLRIIAQAWVLGHRVDFLIGERLILQVDGAHHVGVQRSADILHDARLRLQGYTVFRVSYGQIIDDWPAVQELIVRAVAQGLHLTEG